MDRIELKRVVEDRLVQRWREGAPFAEADLRGIVDEVVEQLGRQEALHNEDVVGLTEAIAHDLRMFGPLWGPMFDAEVSEIMVNGPSRVFVERRGRTEPAGVAFRDEQELRHTIDKVMSFDPTTRLDTAKPLVDISLPDGSRANVAIPPVVNGGAHLTIRKYQGLFRGTDDLVEAGTLDDRMATLLVAATRARLNILFSGGTGVGKTTLLEVLSRTIPAEERVICIEDTMEVHFDHVNVVRMLTRTPNLEGKGEITIGDLFRNSLRMCPDRVILGEIRGKEAYDYLQALNSGHAGSLAVIHASSPEEALVRLQNLVPLAGLGVPPSVVRRQIAHGLDLVVQMDQLPDGTRRVTRITEVGDLGADGELTLRDLFRFVADGRSHGSVRGRFEAQGVVPRFLDALGWSGLHVSPELFREASGAAASRAAASAGAPHQDDAHPPGLRTSTAPAASQRSASASST